MKDQITHEPASSDPWRYALSGACLLLLLTAANCMGDRASAEPPAGAEVVMATTELPQDPPSTCPVTKPPADPFVPPDPYLERPADGFFWYGTAALWTELPESGAWRSLPYEEKGGYTQKIPFWREGYDWQAEPEPALTLTGRRLDALAPPLDAPRATNGYHPDYGSFMLTGGGIPTAGCWEFTGRYADDELTFVVWVAP